jgi:hypothetical protein
MANRWKGNLVSATAATSSGTVKTGKANGVWGLNSQIQQKKANLWSIVPPVPSPAPVITSVVPFNNGARVNFIPPVDNILNITYVVTAMPGNITSGSGSGIGNYINLYGLTNFTSYTFTVTATNNYNESATSEPSSNIMIEPAIGEASNGGFFAGKIMENGSMYALIISPKATGMFTNKTMGNNVNIPPIQPLSTFDGLANTNALVTANSSGALAGTFSGAASCRNLTTGGYNDWYMPARYEMEVLYYFLKPTTQNNIATGGNNPYAVAPEPVNTLYTASAPPQTSVDIFKTGGSESLEALQYWVSNMWQQDLISDWTAFGAQYGRQYFTAWNNAFNIRAIRKILI